MVISGVYDKTLLRNEKDGFTIFGLRIKENLKQKTKYGTIVCKGNIPSYSKETPLSLNGEWEYGTRGEIFKASEYKEYSNDSNIIKNYLIKECEGIGTQFAEKMADKFGSDIFSLIKLESAPKLISEGISGIGETSAVKIVESLLKKTTERELFEFVSRYFMDYSTALKIHKKYGIYSLDKLKENPYKVGIVCGLSFYFCDKVGRDYHLKPYDTYRLKFLVNETFSHYSSQGHTYLTFPQVCDFIHRMISESSYKEIIPSILLLEVLLAGKEYTIVEANPNRYYLTSLWNAENDIVSELKRIKSHNSELIYNYAMIQEIEKELNIRYEDKQKEAFNLLKTTGIKIITGGPGTGKTTLIKGLIEYYQKNYPGKSIALTAPTGRAATRMNEATGKTALTIHRLLEYKPFENYISFKNRYDQIQADFIIVDEFSMVDTYLFSLLLGAAKNDSLIVLVGDENQLPSVGAGNVLRDMIDSGLIETYRLTANMRQEENSSIVANAISINSGNIKLINDDKFELIKVSSNVEASAKANEIAKRIYDKKNPFSIQVLSSTKKYEAGTVCLNKVLQKTLNENYHKKVLFGQTEFRVGDKVMMLKNNYDLCYFNGDQGQIVDIYVNDIVVAIDGVMLTIPKLNMEDMALSYASTVHKAQGCEYDTVITILPDKPGNMLKRNLLYTAVTRAKKKDYVIYVEDSLNIAICASDGDKRNTGLKEILLGKKQAIIKERNKKNDIYRNC